MNGSPHQLPLLERLAIIAILLLLHSSGMSQTSEERKIEIQKREASAPSKEALGRKERSNKRLQEEGVPTIAHLPVIEDSTGAKCRTKDEIAHRAIAVCITAVKGEGVDQATIDRLVKKFGAEKFFSPKEAAFDFH